MIYLEFKYLRFCKDLSRSGDRREPLVPSTIRDNHGENSTVTFRFHLFEGSEVICIRLENVDLYTILLCTVPGFLMIGTQSVVFAQLRLSS